MGGRIYIGEFGMKQIVLQANKFGDAGLGPAD
jgi:hypothetical protein